MTPAEKIAAAFILGGIGGWILENALFYPKPRNSQLFGGRHIPFIPVYAFGAAAVAATAPHIQQLPAVARAGVYAGGLSLLELAACGIDRSMGPPTWDYCNDGDAACKASGDGCVDLPHALAWGVLGLGVDKLST